LPDKYAKMFKLVCQVALYLSTYILLDTQMYLTCIMKHIQILHTYMYIIFFIIWQHRA